MNKTSSMFIGKLRRSGDSTVVTIPKPVAELYKLGQKVKITIDSEQ